MVEDRTETYEGSQVGKMYSGSAVIKSASKRGKLHKIGNGTNNNVRERSGILSLVLRLSRYVLCK